MILVAVILAGLAAGPPAGTTTAPRFRALVFTKTAGFRHTSIDDAVAALDALASETGFQTLHTEDAGQFTDDGLRGFDVVAFVLTTGDVLDPEQEAALQRYVRGGGGFVGVHSATDTEHGWPWYGDLVGASFVFHPPVQDGIVRVTDRHHPSTRFLPRGWPRTDEWYEFDRNPRRHALVLATVDERSYDGGSMGSDHPIAWCHRFQGGRAWYTALGHPDESYGDPQFRRHLLKGLEWAAGAIGGSCDPDAGPEVVSIRSDPDAGAFSGGVFTSRSRCEARRRVVVLKVRPGKDREVGRRRTDAIGDWRLAFESARGRFRAVAPAESPCHALRSAPIRTG
jgi:type 1 glutamine amidotransferase